MKPSKMIFKPKSHGLKLEKEELQGLLQAKRQFTGSHRSKKDYNRQTNKRLAKKQDVYCIHNAS